MTIDKHFFSNKNKFEELFRLTHKPLKLYAMRFVMDADVAEDIIQDVFVNLWRQRNKIVVKGSIKSYLFSSVYNHCLNFLKKNKKVHKIYLSEETEIENFENYYVKQIIYKKKSLLSREVGEEIKQAIQKLPEQQRRVIILSRKFGLKNREIAEYLEISIKVVEKHISKALSTLRNLLKDHLNSLL